MMGPTLEGANCADLLPFVVDKYFGCDSNHEALRAKVAKAICSHCKVIDACREQAMTAPKLPERGVVAGLSVGEIHRGRAWQLYEAGVRDTVPRASRPDWLPMSDATQVVEQMRVEEDPDEVAS
jgi:hypothetical protein